MSESVRGGVGDVSRLSRAAALDALEELQRVKAAAEAWELRLLARVDALDEAEHPGLRWERESVSTILRCAPVTARGRLGQARQLVDTLPATVAALAAGRITAMHARVLADATAGLNAEATGLVEAKVLDKADTASVPEFRAYCTKTVLAVDPAGAQRQHEQAAEDRRVEFRPGGDGMGDVYARVTAEQLARVRQHLDACTDTVLAGINSTDFAAGLADDRSRDAVRADVFCDLLTGGAGTTDDTTPAHRDRPIQVTVPLSTLLNLDELPGELDGEPVAASLARQLANDPNAWWRPVLIDRDGHLEAVGARHYRPSAALQRMVKLHDKRWLTRLSDPLACRRDPADATVALLPSPTSEPLTVFENLHCLCKRHHRLKHEAGWTVIRKDGITTWTSPQGRRHQKFFDPYLDPVDPNTAEPDTVEPEPTEPGNPADDPPPV